MTATLEKQYLACVLDGGDVEDIMLSPVWEKVHLAIKDIRAQGLHEIGKGLIPGTDELYTIEGHYDLTAYYANQIREKNKKAQIRQAIKNINPAIPASDIVSVLHEELDKISQETGRSKIKTAREIYNTAYENTEFIITNILPVGLTIFFAAPKIGKSWLLLLMSDCISRGVPSIFGFSVKKTAVLYYTLEDNIRRCKYRLNKLGSLFSENLFFSEVSNGPYGIMNHVRTTGARCVIIDTFGAFMSARIQDNNDYTETTRIIREIKEIADVMQVAIILVHHTHKGEGSKDWTENAMGSQGLVGAADVVWGLERERSGDKGRLNITGRDIPDAYMDLHFNDGTWEKV